MTIHRFTPRGFLPDEPIDALLDKFGSDEWLPTALKVPLCVGLASCALMAVALALLILAPSYTQTALTLAALWPVAVTYSILSMRALARKRQAENRAKQER